MGCMECGTPNDQKGNFAGKLFWLVGVLGGYSFFTCVALSLLLSGSAE